MCCWCSRVSEAEDGDIMCLWVNSREGFTGLLMKNLFESHVDLSVQTLRTFKWSVV